MGPPGMPSLGGMLPITGLGAAAALCKTHSKGENNVSVFTLGGTAPKHGNQYNISIFSLGERVETSISEMDCENAELTSRMLKSSVID